jgi:uncharacterized protein YxeA
VDQKTDDQEETRVNQTKFRKKGGREEARMGAKTADQGQEQLEVLNYQQKREELSQKQDAYQEIRRTQMMFQKEGCQRREEFCFQRSWGHSEKGGNQIRRLDDPRSTHFDCRSWWNGRGCVNMCPELRLVERI